jgi:hypothetical protein
MIVIASPPGLGKMATQADNSRNHEGRTMRRLAITTAIGLALLPAMAAAAEAPSQATLKWPSAAKWTQAVKVRPHCAWLFNPALTIPGCLTPAPTALGCLNYLPVHGCFNPVPHCAWLL